jgi:hypothetical protein
MSGKEIGGQKKYFKYADCKPGDVLVDGKFLRDFQGKYGIQWEYLDNSGEVVVLNSAGQLNYKMDAYVSPGDMVQIIYEGMITLDKGPMSGKDSHQFKLIDMGKAPVAKTETKAVDSAEDSEDDDEYGL